MKRKIIILKSCALLLFAMLPIVAWGQSLNIKQMTGEEIPFYFSDGAREFRPIVKDGKVVWSFNHDSHDSDGDNWCVKEVLSLDNVESIEVRTREQDSLNVRKALIEFYNALDGDHWINNENWCSDKPIEEWYGVNTFAYNSRWVAELSLEENIVTGNLPDCITRMGPIRGLFMSQGKRGNLGVLPSFLERMYDLERVVIQCAGLKGDIPNLFNLPNFYWLDLSGNDYEGNLPEELIVKSMDNPSKVFRLMENHYSGKVPEGIRNHSRFAETWPNFIVQSGDMDLSDLNIPAPCITTVDIDGNTINLGETYKNNKYTLLYLWGAWCSASLAFNPTLEKVYNGYKDKGLEIIGIHRFEDELLPDYLKEHPLPWRNVYADDLDGFGDLFCRFISPQIDIVDQNGNIVFTDWMDKNGDSNNAPSYEDALAFLEEHLGKIEYDYYTSTDYLHDGEVATLQTATKGQGVDLVFIGEGFTDKDIAEGTYDQNISKAVDQFFAYEPYNSLRKRFNVYSVKAVSPNAEFMDGCTHAIDEDVSKALEYASKVQYLIPNRPMHVVVVYNNPSGGRSYCMMMEDDSFVCFAMDGVSTVLNHEAGGHGFGKLFDEYVENGNESLALPEDDKREMENKWTTLGWGANVDWRSNPAEVKWAKFINDEHYADERIGVYEGSYLYGSSAYRPTENSMMRNNDVGFNAPSREEIYKRVMKESEGDSWTYDYETFVAFDVPGHEQFVGSLSNVGGTRGEKVPKMQEIQRTAPPVFLKGTWRDALKKK